MIITASLQTTSIPIESNTTTTNSPPANSLSTSTTVTTIDTTDTKAYNKKVNNHTTNGVIYISGLETDFPVNYSWVKPATHPSHNGRTYLTTKDFPNPQISPILCGRYDPSFVCDPSRNLTESEG